VGEISSGPREGSSGQPVPGSGEPPQEAGRTSADTAAELAADGPAEPSAGADPAPPDEPAGDAAEPSGATPDVPAGGGPEDDGPAVPDPTDTTPTDPGQPGAAEAQRLAAAQAAADLAEVKRWAAERAAAERAATEATERATAAQAAADAAELERARAEQAAADLAAVREWAAQRAAADQAAADQAAADQVAVEQAEAARLDAERLVAEQAAAERAALERAEVERLAADRAAHEQAEAERTAAAAEMAAERAAIEQEAAERQAAARAAAARAAGERADVERAQAEWAAGRQAAAEQAATEAAQRPPQAAAGPRNEPRGATAAPVPSRRRVDRATTGGRGRLAKVLLAAALAVLLVAGGVVLALNLTRDDGGSTVAEQVPDAVLPQLSDPGPVLAELSASAPLPDPAVLTATLTPLLAAPELGSGLSAQVVDVATGRVLFDRDADDPSTPASTAKLLTSLAALTTLGPTDTIPTTVVAGSTPGEVVLVGGGDPTLSTTAPSTDYPGAATVADLAGQVQQALGGQPVTRVVVDNSLFTGPLTATGWGAEDTPSTYAAPVTATAVDGARVTPGKDLRSGSPGTDAGEALAAALSAPTAPVGLGTAPLGARTLGTVHSAPIARLVEEALTASDNLLAESLARQVAIARGLPASFDGAAAAVTAAVAAAGLDTAGLTLNDGSGLSQDDRVPASLLVEAVRAAADGSIAGADGLLSGLPVAGYDGTLAERAVDAGAAAPGAVRAKTGTLLGVNDLAGTVLTADGRLLAFAVLADGATGSVTTSETALDVVADALAGCGCR
jgi:D-alanyl-D-alanine carboxypeptidase/D-alanyl-D-alanine-endopeptidase (penicillin-binding protein 4)